MSRGTCVEEEALEHQTKESTFVLFLLGHVGRETGCRIPIDLLTELGPRVRTEGMRRGAVEIDRERRARTRMRELNRVNQ